MWLDLLHYYASGLSVLRACVGHCVHLTCQFLFGFFFSLTARASDLSKAAKPRDETEEALQLELAMALSREEAEKERKMR